MGMSKKEWINMLKPMALVVIVAILMRLFFFAPVLVDGHSMEPTLHDLNKVIVSQISYTFNEPKRFDIVVFKSPTEDRYYVKRIIGLPNETLFYLNDQLYIDGQYIEEPFLDQTKEDLTEGNLTENFQLMDKIGQQTIPEDHVFVMGDNRLFSKDSRHFGTIPIKDIYGKGLFVYWPLKDFKWMK